MKHKKNSRASGGIGTSSTTYKPPRRRPSLQLILTLIGAVIVLIVGGYVTVSHTVLPKTATNALAQALEEKDGSRALKIYKRYCGEGHLQYDSLSPAGKAVYNDFVTFFSGAYEEINRQPADADLDAYIRDTYGDLFSQQRDSLTDYILYSNKETLAERVTELYSLLASKQAYQSGVKEYENKNWVPAQASLSQVIEKDAFYADAQEKLLAISGVLMLGKLDGLNPYVDDRNADGARDFIDTQRNGLDEEQAKLFDEALKSKANQYIEKAEAALKAGDRQGAYDEALFLQEIFPDNETVTEKIAYFEAYLPFELHRSENHLSVQEAFKGDAIYGADYWSELTANDGTVMKEPVTVTYCTTSESPLVTVTYSLGKKYDVVSGTGFVPSADKNKEQKGWFVISGDGKTLYTSPAFGINVLPQPFTVDVAGVDMLTVEYYGETPGIGMTYAAYGIADFVALKALPQ